MEDKPMLTFDAQTYEVSWNIDQNDSRFVPSLAKVLVDLHQAPIPEAETAVLKILTPDMLRQEVLDRVETVKRELGISAELEARWLRWLDSDNLWSQFTTLIHGDLYVGHILADTNCNISGIIDWSEGQLSDPSIDFSGHVTVSGEESLKELIRKYEEFGGQV